MNGSVRDWLTVGLLVVGALAMLLAALGVLRMPDVFTRLQATSKAATLGVGCMMLAVAVHFAELAVTTRAVAVVLFTFLTAPIGAHMIGRAAYVAKAALWERTTRDDLRGCYDGAGPATGTAPGNGRHPSDLTQTGGGRL
jgi:multicomponent Na+:H+ antiporter subunit G